MSEVPRLQNLQRVFAKHLVQRDEFVENALVDQLPYYNKGTLNPKP